MQTYCIVKWVGFARKGLELGDPKATEVKFIESSRRLQLGLLGCGLDTSLNERSHGGEIGMTAKMHFNYARTEVFLSHKDELRDWKQR